MAPCAPTASEEANPFMALVDAAASILDKDSKPELTDVSSSGKSLSSESESSSVSSAAGSRSATPLVASPASIVGKIVETRYDKKLSFAEQLMAILDDENYSDLLVWMPDGEAFTIVDPKKFTKDHMPKLFNIRNMSSFVRKLTRWGFSRVHEKETMNSDIFRHRKFKRGMQDLCAEIKCVGKPSTSSGASPLASLKAACSTSQQPSLPKSNLPTRPSQSPSQGASSVTRPPVNMLGKPLESQRSLPEQVIDPYLFRRLVECQRSHQLAATAGLHVPAWLQARNESLYALKHAMLANWGGAYHPSLQY